MVLPPIAVSEVALGRQLLGQAAEPSGVDNGDGQQDEEDANGLDDELHEVGQRDRPHPAQGGVDDHHAAAQDDGRHLCRC